MGLCSSDNSILINFVVHFLRQIVPVRGNDMILEMRTSDKVPAAMQGTLLDRITAKRELEKCRGVALQYFIVGLLGAVESFERLDNVDS